MPDIDNVPRHHDPVNDPSTEAHWNRRAQELLNIFDVKGFPCHSGCISSTPKSINSESEQMTLSSISGTQESQVASMMMPLDRVLQQDAEGGLHLGPKNQNLVFDAVMSACEKAKAAKAIHDAAKSELTLQLETAMALLIQRGMVVQRHQGGEAFWLHRLKTTRGNDRGTNTFEIAGKPVIRVDMANPELSTWSVEAIPISEKTGKSMSGAAHGSNARCDTVSLSGEMAIDLHSEDGQEIQDFFARLILAAQKKAPKAWPEGNPSSPTPSVAGWIEP